MRLSDRIKRLEEAQLTESRLRNSYGKLKRAHADAVKAKEEARAARADYTEKLADYAEIAEAVANASNTPEEIYREARALATNVRSVYAQVLGGGGYLGDLESESLPLVLQKLKLVR